MNFLHLHSPLAGGFLTGKFTSSTPSDALKGTRFQEGVAIGGVFRRWYDKPIWHDANAKFRSLCNEHGITMPEAALRWITYHSQLIEGDAVILGASRVPQLTTAMEQIKKGPLPETLVNELNTLGESLKRDAAGIVRVEAVPETAQRHQNAQKEAKEAEA